VIAALSNLRRRHHLATRVYDFNLLGLHGLGSGVSVKTAESCSRFSSLKPAVPPGWMIRWWFGSFRVGSGITSNPTLRILSAEVEPIRFAISWSAVASGNTSRICRATSPGDDALRTEIPGGSSLASLGFRRRFST